jgi:WhiB family transcriptional regulator, redox-sensing transcriptional regulator
MSPISATIETPVAFLPSAAPLRQESLPTSYTPPEQPELTRNSFVPGSVRPATWNDLAWRQDAACASVATETFFPIGLTGQALEQTHMAKRVCASCPVRDCCLEFALRTNQDHGVWGGHTEEERRTIRRSRRAAARKAAARAS